MNDISDSTRRDPSNFLTIGRTIMANERTLLAFLRTSIAFFVAGIGLIKYLDHPVFDAIGWIFVVLAGNIFDLGSTPAQTCQKSIEGSNTGRSTNSRKGDGSMNENAKKLFGATATPLASIFGSGFSGHRTHPCRRRGSICLAGHGLRLRSGLCYGQCHSF